MTSLPLPEPDVDQRRLSLILIVGIACAFATLFVCNRAINNYEPRCLRRTQPGDSIYPLLATGLHPDTFSDVSFSTISFPHSMTHFRDTCFNWQGGYHRISFEMDEDELDAFLAGHDVKDLSPAQTEPWFGPKRWLRTADGYEFASDKSDEYPVGSAVWIDPIDNGRVRVFISVGYGD